MHFRNAHIAACEEAPEGVLDEYHVRNNIEGEYGHLKVHHSLESALNVVGERAVLRHMPWTVVAAQVVAMVRLQHGVGRTCSRPRTSHGTGNRRCGESQSEVAMMRFTTVLRAGRKGPSPRAHHKVYLWTLHNERRGSDGATRHL